MCTKCNKEKFLQDISSKMKFEKQLKVLTLNANMDAQLQVTYCENNSQLIVSCM